MTDTTRIAWAETLTGATPGEDLYTRPPYQTCSQSEIVVRPGRENGRAAKTWIERGQSGYGEFGYSVSLPEFENMVEGDEIWWSVEQHFPDGFNFWTDHGSLKWFRLGRILPGGSNRGYVDVQINSGSRQSWRANVEYKQAGEPSWETFTGGDVVKGQTQRFEFYCKLGVDDGIIRMYRDGVLFGETTRQTIGRGELIQRVLLCTYWNGDAPQHNEMFLGDTYIAVKTNDRDDTPYLDDDGMGNKYIGSDFGSQPPVEPPVEPPVPPTEPTDPNPPVTPPELLQGTTVHVDENAVYIASDQPVVVIRSDGRESMV
jgi:hypothetical protein